MLFLGVDGGGTKTAFALIDDDGAIVAELESTTCYHAEVGLDGAKTVLAEGLNAILHAAHAGISDIAFAFYGLPAYGEDSDLTFALDKLPSSFLNHEQYTCDNDMVNGWAAAFDCGDGINVVSGTGSIAYGVRESESARCGGWGELFGDEGSAYWIGRRGLQAFSKMSDGRMPRGSLYHLLKASLAVRQDIDVSGLVHGKWGGERSRISSLAKIVADAAAADDNEAKKILTDAGCELAQIVDSIRRILGFNEDELVRVAYSGGVFSAKELIMEPFEKTLTNLSSQYSLRKPAFSPVIGAARYARHIAAARDTRPNSPG